MMVPNFHDDVGGWPMLFALIGIAVLANIVGFWMGWFLL